MPRTIVIRIVVDNRDAVNAIKAQREEDARLRDSVKFTNEELRKNAAATKDAADAHNKASQGLNNLTASFFKGFLAARALSEVYGAVTSSVTYLIAETAKYELSLAKVSAVTGDSKESISNLSDVIFKLSRNTAASVNEIGGAALELAKLGFEGKSLEIALAGVARLSSILGDSLETTGNLVGGVIQVFDLSATEAAKVADKLFIATGKSATNIEGFRIAFALAGNVAHDAGITFDQLSAAIAALSNQGIRASTIGTGLRNFIGELSKDGSKAQAALGGSIESLGLVGAMEKLASLQLSPGSLIEIFGKPGAPVASGLSHAKEAYDQFINSIANSQGQLDQAKDKINDTLIGSITIFKNSLVELTSVTLGGASSGLADVFSGVSKSINQATDDIKVFQSTLQTAFSKSREDLLRLGLEPEQVVGGRIQGPNAAEVAKRLQALKEADTHDIRSSDDVIEALFGKQQEEEKKKKNKLATDPKAEAITKLEDVQINFDLFKAGRGEFDFDKNEKALSGLVDQLERLGDKKGELRVLAELIDLQKEEKRISDASEKDRVDRIKFDLGIDKTLSNIDKSFTPKKQSKKDIEAAKSDEQKYQDYLKKTNDELDTYNTKLNLTKESFDALGGAVDVFANSLANVFVGQGLDSFDNFKEGFKKLAQSFIAQLIAMEIRLVAFKLALKLFGFIAGGATGAAIGSTAGEIGAQQFDQFYGPATQATDVVAANGFNGVVTGPTTFMAGEAGAERVSIMPLGKSGVGNGSNGITIIVQGDVYNAEKLVDKIAQTNERSRTRYV